MFAVVLVSTLLCQQLPAAPSPIGAADWSPVLALHAGTSVRISEENGTRSNGTLIKADGAILTLSDGISNRDIRRSSVTRVERRLETHHIRNGFFAGAAFGFVLTTVAVKNSYLLAYPFFTFGWGGVGAAGGALSSALDRRYETVFDRR